MSSTKYITSMGDLSRKDNTLLFRNEKGLTHIPIENVSEIYCLSEVSINTKVLDFLSRNKVVVHFFNYHENYSGTFYPKSYLLSGKLLIKQVEAYKIKRIEIAKSIVKGIGKNIYEVIYHYYKHDKKEVKMYLDYIKNDFFKKLDKASDIKKILQCEGELWQGFYSQFKYILPEDFVMNKRVKRPPDNPINALVSFGNSLLYAKVVTIIYNTHLDQRVSFLHELSERRFSLSLDISEAFKPITVFKTIFELVNMKKLRVDKHFDKKLNYCLLNEKGKNIFIEAFEGRLNSHFKHSKLNRKVTYKHCIKLDCYKLLKTALEDKEFVPFSVRKKV